VRDDTNQASTKLELHQSVDGELKGVRVQSAETLIHENRLKRSTRRVLLNGFGKAEGQGKGSQEAFPA